MDKTLFARRCGAALIAAAMSIPVTADAQSTAATKKPTKQSATKSKPKPMSREQLRACMDQQDRLTAMRQKVLQEEASLDKQRAEVTKLDADLAAKRAALDPADAAAKEALTAEEAKRNQVADAYNTRLPTLREQVSALNTERQGWVDQCANKDFDEIDEYAIKRDRDRAAKAVNAKK
ncbi:MAG: hypothetical protein ACRECQ_17850 [Burkholderiaceae bacterium]